MIYERKRSFKRVFEKLPLDRQEKITAAIEELINLYESGTRTEGLGLKRLYRDIWEIRSSIKDRILFSLEDEVVTFLIVGNHDDIRRYLKNL